MAATVLRIVFAYYMVSHPGEWLVKYALFVCLINILPQIIICIRANCIFIECKINFSYMCNAQYLKKIGSYVCWTFFGNLASLLRSQGISLLINKAFGPKVNSAMHIAHRVESGTSILSSALHKAFAPAIITAAGTKNYEKTAFAHGRRAHADAARHILDRGLLLHSALSSSCFLRHLWTASRTASRLRVESVFPSAPG